MIEIIKIEPSHWVKLFSEDAHMAVFGENKPATLDRIDFTLLALDNDKPIGYMTCREFDSESVYWQYGGVVDEKKGTVYAMKTYGGVNGDFSTTWCTRNCARPRSMSTATWLIPSIHNWVQMQAVSSPCTAPRFVGVALC